MKLRTSLGLGLPILLLATPAAATETAGRYSMSPTDGGFVRLDTQTGVMSLCTSKGPDWNCTDMAESAESGRKRLDELMKENQALKDEIQRLELQGVPGADKPKLTMPDEKDVDKAFDYLESMMKKFRERMKKLEEKEPEGTPL